MVGWLRRLCGGWLYSDYNASLSSNWTELDWTGTELGNRMFVINYLILLVRKLIPLAPVMRLALFNLKYPHPPYLIGVKEISKNIKTKI